jgi:type IV secretory pathway VirB2 component (pilin)
MILLIRILKGGNGNENHRTNQKHAGKYQPCVLVICSQVSGYLITTAHRMISLTFLPRSERAVETQVTEALNPLARLLVGPVAKGLAIIGLFAFVGFLYAGRWMMAVSSLVAAVILGLLANIVTAIFQGSNATAFTLGG